MNLRAALFGAGHLPKQLCRVTLPTLGEVEPEHDLKILPNGERVLSLGDRHAIFPWCPRRVYRITAAMEGGVGGRDSQTLILEHEAAFWCREMLGPLSVGPGSRVVVWANEVRVIVGAAIATFELHATLCVLDARTPVDVVRAVVDELAADVVIADDGLASTLGSSPACLIVCTVDAHGVSARVVPTAAQVERADISQHSLPNDTALVVYTSGSTGRRRGVVLSRSNVDFAVGAIQRRLGYRATDTIGIHVPLAFDYGLYQLFLARNVGARISIANGHLAGPHLLNQLAEGSTTVLPAVPSLLVALVRLLRRRSVALPALRMITSTGDHLPPPLVRELRELLPHVDVYPMYGLTECKRISILLPGEFDERPSSVGRPLDGTKVFAIDELGGIVQPGHIGQLVVIGPHVGHGYINAPTESANTFRDFEGARALFTGDWGCVDAEGFIYLEGRRDSLFKRRGLRMSGLEVESAALNVPGVEQAALVRDGDYLTLFLRAPAGVVNDVRNALEACLESYKLPDVVKALTEFPLTENGKTDRKRLSSLASP